MATHETRAVLAELAAMMGIKVETLRVRGELSVKLAEWADVCLAKDPDRADPPKFHDAC